jgi:pimeloyl-ACP methyl ester carboxylesterase
MSSTVNARTVRPPFGPGSGLRGRGPLQRGSGLRVRGPLRRVLLVGLLVATVLLFREAETHLRAASLLLRFADAGATGALASYGKHAVHEELAPLVTKDGALRARVYTPEGVSNPPGVVVVHGVHRLGIDEPRLTRFARAIAATGVTVFTPEVSEIADYRVDPRSIDTIGAAATALSARLGHGRVGVMGMSFAGGLALLAAADDRFASAIGFVVAVGAHHDLARVLRFFLSNQVERPDGTREPLKAHEYGALVLIYGHMEAFVPKADAAVARDAVRLWLWEQRDAAREREKSLSPEARAVIDALFDNKIEAVAPAFEAELARDSGETARVSPRGHLGALKVPVFLLHGAGDTVIPAAETLWIASEVPPDLLRAALVSSAVVHVEIQGEPALSERWALVHFMARILDEAEANAR